MNNKISVIFLLLTYFSCQAQYKISCNSLLKNLGSIKENKVILCSEDDFQSTYLLALTKVVPSHYHENHTENIFVIRGKAVMTLGDKVVSLKKGVHVNIPRNTIHSVDKIKSKKPLIVISVQSPKFNPIDRIFIDSKNKQDKY